MKYIGRTSLALTALAAVGTAGSLAQAAPMKLTSGQMDQVTASGGVTASGVFIVNLGGGGGGGGGGAAGRDRQVPRPPF